MRVDELLEIRQEWSHLLELTREQNVLLGEEECIQVIKLIDSYLKKFKRR